jgi:hypothetical protein
MMIQDVVMLGAGEEAEKNGNPCPHFTIKGKI